MCVHYWLIDSENKGKCKLCGAEHDFTEDNKKAFPIDYIKGFVGNLAYERIHDNTGGFYMQGTLRINRELEDNEF